MKNQPAPSERHSPLTRLKAALGQVANATMQYGKDVATGKKLMEGLKQHDGAIDGLISHGANELATVLLTGNPAPVYARSLSPQDQDTSHEIEPMAEGEVAAQPAGEIVTHEQAKAATHHEVTVNQNAGEDMQQTLFQSSLGQLVNRIRSLSPSQEPQREITQ
jgi:hypothetical protein